MFSTIQIIFLVVLTLSVILRPYLIILREKKLNQKCPIQMGDSTGTTTYYLHFNPKKQYITLYTEKMNIKK